MWCHRPGILSKAFCLHDEELLRIKSLAEYIVIWFFTFKNVIPPVGTVECITAVVFTTKFYVPVDIVQRKLYYGGKNSGSICLSVKFDRKMLPDTRFFTNKLQSNIARESGLSGHKYDIWITFSYWKLLLKPYLKLINIRPSYDIFN